MYCLSTIYQVLFEYLFIWKNGNIRVRGVAKPSPENRGDERFSRHGARKTEL